MKSRAGGKPGENAKKARKIADKLFPNEQWTLVEDGIYLSPNRPVGGKSNYKDELRDAQILRDSGNIVYLVPDARNNPNKKYDAIVNGLKFEFKNVGGNANTLEIQFLRSRSQAPNVFINLETSNMTKKQIKSVLSGARNKRDSAKSPGYNHYNKFMGGRIILKIRGKKKLLFINVDDMKAPG